MSDLEQRLHQVARQLLTEGTVETIIGYERGTMPLRTTPCFIRDPEQVDRLVWNTNCENNLATFLQHVTGKVGIVAKGCDTRSIIGKMVERQIPRENVTIIGVPCQGVLDRRSIEHQLDGREVLEAHVANGQITLSGQGFEETLAIRELMCNDCVTCRHKMPVVYDILVGEPDADTRETDSSGSEYPTMQELESWTADERWSYFSDEFSRCIRCYACREACPCCFCTECFVDQTQPSWIDKSDDLSDVIGFHLVRLYHVAGRCLDCGACARACPMHIDLRTLGRKLEKDVRELYGYEPGLDLESAPFLGSFRPDDPDGFIK